MPEQLITLPFTVPDLFAGFAAGQGLAKVTPSELTLEFVIKDNLLAILKSGVKAIRIPGTEIDFICLKRGWFATKVLIRVKSMKWLSDFPGADNGEVTLHISRRDRDQAAKFVQAFSESLLLRS